MKTITKQQLIEMEPCDLDDRIEMFGDADSMNIKQAFKAGFTVSDILWLCGELKLPDVVIKFAYACSERAQEYAAHTAAAARYADAADRYARYADAAAHTAAAAAHTAADRYGEIEKQKEHLMELLK